MRIKPVGGGTVKLVLFDLDGTLVDTAPDLGLALNIQRQRYALPALEMAAIRPFASHGSRGLLGVGFGLQPGDERFEAMREEYLALYDQVFAESSTLFEGMDQVLTALQQRGLPWGVVTNKPRRFAAPLMQALQLDHSAACLVCADDAVRAKPDPETLYMACRQVGVAASDAIYVGDAERDIQAGKAAGMRTVLAAYGYIASTDSPEAWAADTQIETPLDLLSLLPASASTA